MSFENGYNINDYIGDTINIYKMDKNIFIKTINALNVFMQRKDWPMCYNEFNKISTEILGIDTEWICRTIGMFTSQKSRLENQADWNFELDYDFEKDVIYFINVVNPIIEQYYNYINNPLGINRIIQIDNISNQKLFRISRIDGENFDLRMSKYEIEQLISTLNSIIER
ncbi:hypothetical protein [Clostridium botulinum]|uniref:hypothetical protein n=1 Tax=Clostridium botulinum TaxID=1491 RepID=UPI000774E3D7|nr:hypothetical protein [Clostridium botulinum]MBY6931693.1 hypothetical protein [Clostridium botulinum]NFG20521.1 hypothetical protein [Clostridium botulinum]NFO80695.1 hypothetical protein [Clostridium botulinum]